jgi:hypothetical protein
MESRNGQYQAAGAGGLQIEGAEEDHVATEPPSREEKVTHGNVGIRQTRHGHMN